MKRVNIQMILIWVFALLPSIIVGTVYNKLPQKIIIHIGITGNLRYGDKKVLWVLSIISIFISIFFVLLKKKGNKKVDEFSDEYYAVLLSVVIFMFGMIMITILNSFGIDIFPIQNVVIFCSAILFAVIGSIIKDSSNFKFMNMWTKRDYEVLKKTQKFAGSLFVITALILAIATIFTSELKLSIVVIGVIVCNLIIPNVMSYIWYKRRYRK